MVIVFDNPTKNDKGVLNNSGSSYAYVNYMDKENDLKVSNEKWFNYENMDIEAYKVRQDIDKDHQGIGKNEGKFATGSINPTLEEWQSLGKTDEERLINFRKWVSDEFTKEFANNFNKVDRKGDRIDIKPDNVKIYYKIEHNRYYTGLDEEVKQGIKQQKEQKEGFNLHCHFIVARKTIDGNYRISPTTNNRKEFDRTQFINKLEKNFDKYTGYKRPIEQTFDYCKTIKNGTFKEKELMINKKIEQNFNQNKQLQNEQNKNNDRNKNNNLEITL